MRANVRLSPAQVSGSAVPAVSGRRRVQSWLSIMEGSPVLVSHPRVRWRSRLDPASWSAGHQLVPGVQCASGCRRAGRSASARPAAGGITRRPFDRLRFGKKAVYEACPNRLRSRLQQHVPKVRPAEARAEPDSESTLAAEPARSRLDRRLMSHGATSGSVVPAASRPWREPRCPRCHHAPPCLSLAEPVGTHSDQRRTTSRTTRRAATAPPRRGRGRSVRPRRECRP